MKIEMIAAVIDPGNDSAPLTYNVDGSSKQIAWGDLHDLFEQRCAENDQEHTQEQRLLAQIVSQYWEDCEDWWCGAVAEG